MGKKNKKEEVKDSIIKEKVVVTIKTYEECKKCINNGNGCNNGRIYVNNFIPGRCYNGCVCKKVISAK